MSELAVAALKAPRRSNNAQACGNRACLQFYLFLLSSRHAELFGCPRSGISSHLFRNRITSKRVIEPLEMTWIAYYLRADLKFTKTKMTEIKSIKSRTIAIGLIVIRKQPTKIVINWVKMKIPPCDQMVLCLFVLLLFSLLSCT